MQNSSYPEGGFVLFSYEQNMPNVNILDNISNLEHFLAAKYHMFKSSICYKFAMFVECVVVETFVLHGYDCLFKQRGEKKLILTLWREKVRTQNVASSMVSSRVTWIVPYVSVPRLGQYWSHFI